MQSYSLPTDYQNFIHLSKYSRWSDSLQRRETWQETVDRYITYYKNRLEGKLSNEDWEDCRANILSLGIMPSMRALMSAGKAMDSSEVAQYNCSYIPIDNPHSFDEIIFILMNGTGVGFSVESKYVNKLPIIPSELYETDTTVVVKDSKIGWASGFRELMSLLYAGKIPKWDTSKVRPKGSRLKTFGGRASGPEPLIELFKYVVTLFKNAAGRKLTDLECHDICCKIADIIVVGGQRRSALISISDLGSVQMRDCKSGKWWDINPQRSFANNSVGYESKPSMGIFMQEWQSLYMSKSGERGIFNRQAAKKAAEETGRRDPNYEFGMNPCGEILLRPYQFCNLSNVNIFPGDSLIDLENKVRLATILGTIQSAFTNFKYLNKKWKNNCDEERLLGVSFSGIYDHQVMSGNSNHCELQTWLAALLEVARSTNAEYADKLGIPRSMAITCVKPSGNTSELCGISSGIHPRWAEYYLRSVRVAKTDPLGKMMMDIGFYGEDDLVNTAGGYVFYFPQKSPKTATLRKNETALSQLQLWLNYKKFWCEHNPSATIYVKEHEWLEVGAWVYEHFDEACGLAFLPSSDHIYKQAPYQDLTKEEYESWLEKMPKNVDWNKLVEYEKEDNTTNSKELSCVGGVCEL